MSWPKTGQANHQVCACCCRMVRQQTVNVFLSALVSLLFHFSVVQFHRKYAHCTDLWEWHCGNGNKDENCFPVGQFSIFVPGKFFSHCRLHFTTQILSAISMTSSTLSGTFPTDNFIASFSLFWSCKVNRFLESSNTCIPHKCMPSSSCLSQASCL